MVLRVGHNFDCKELDTTQLNNNSTILRGMQSGTAAMGNSMEIPQKIKNGTTF